MELGESGAANGVDCFDCHTIRSANGAVSMPAGRGKAATKQENVATDAHR
jgi:hypothetical protein